MSGYLVNVFRNQYSDEPNDDSVPFINFHSNNALLLGHYDYMEIFSIKAAPDFYFSKEENPIWDGEKQTIYLYSLKKDQNINSQPDNSWTYKSGYNNAQEYNLKVEIENSFSGKMFKPVFACISLLTLSNDAGKRLLGISKRKELIDKITGVIKAKTPPEDSNLKFEVLASLGASQLGIFWLADDIDIFAIYLPLVRDMLYKTGGNSEPEKLFFTNYSMISVIPQSGSEKKLVKLGSTTKIFALMSVKPTCDKMQFINEFKAQFPVEPDIYDRHFSQDVAMIIDAKYIPLSMYTMESEDQMSFTNSKFLTYCHRNHSRLLFSIDDQGREPPQVICVGEHELKPYFSNLFREDIFTVETQKTIYDPEKMFNITKNLLEPSSTARDDDVANDKRVRAFFLKNSHIKEAIYQIYYGLRRCCASVINEKLREDLLVQYYAFIRSIEGLLVDSTMLPDKDHPQNDNINKIVLLLESIQQNYQHINEGSKVYSDASSNSVSYTGSRRRMIWTYYGVLKRFLDLVYSMNRKSKQEELVPLLRYSTQSEVKSECFTYRTADNTEGKLILITLPYASFYHIPKFIAYLAHEIFHYVAPPDRKYRNYIMSAYTVGKCISTALMELYRQNETIVLSIIDTSVPENEDTDANKYNMGQAASIFSYWLVSQRYSETMEALRKNDAVDRPADLKMIGSGDVAWKELFSSTIDRISDSGNFELFFDYILNALNEFCDNSKIFMSTEINEKGRQLLTALTGVCKNGNSAADTEHKDTWSRIIKKDYYGNEIAYSVISGFQEACCDFFMIQLTGFKSCYYLNFLADHLFVRGFTSDDINKLGDNLVSNPIFMRVGIILDYFADKLYKGEKKEKAVNEMLNEWKNANDKIRETRLKDKREIERVDFRINCFGIFKTLYEYYQNEMTPDYSFRSLFQMGEFEWQYQNIITEANECFDWRSKANIFRVMAKQYEQIQNSDANPKKEDRASLYLDLHIMMIEFFTYQPSLIELNSYCGNQNKLAGDYEINWPGVATNKTTSIEYSQLYRFEVNSRERFFEILNIIINKLRRNSKINTNSKASANLWFRGLANANHSLVPTLFRNKDNFDGKTYRALQYYYDQFNARAVGTVETDMTQMRSEIDWLALMQHYSAPTNLLDFSELLLSAMYFMLEPVILEERKKNDAEIKRKADNTRENGAALYVFDPVAYDEAWKRYLNTATCATHFNKLRNLQDYVVPNLSIPYAAEQFSAYILGDDELKRNCNGKKHSCDLCPIQFPLAIYTSMSNARIRQQAGTFLAYSLHYFGTKDSAAFENVQDKFLNDYKKNIEAKVPPENYYGAKKPFLYKITVTGHAINELKEWVVNAGMRTFRVYPDLNYIGENLTD